MSNFYIPEDLLINVLSRLPAKILLRFRRVSRSWYDLIDSKNFLKMNLNRLKNTDSESKIIVSGRSMEERSRLYTIDCSTNVVKELDFPPLNNHKNSYIEVLGSCNGVICLYYGRGKIVLWNPLSQKYREIMSPRISCRSYFQAELYCAYGFGYDKNTDDYKVCLKAGNDSNFSCNTWIYSLKLKRWKKIENFSYYRGPRENAIFVNGALHWITRDDLILAFDLTDEKFYIVPKPNFSSAISVLDVGIHGDCLSLTCQNSTYSVCKMWVMKDYGIKDSWTRIYLERQHIQGCWFLRPITSLKSNKQLILHCNYNEILVYDSITRSVQKIDLQHEDDLEIYPYLETLECFDDTTVRRSCRQKKRTRREDIDGSSSFMNRP